MTERSRFQRSEPWRGTDPCVEIRIPVEGTPAVTLIAFSYDDEQRIREWIASRADLAQLVDWCAEYRNGEVCTVQSLIVENLMRRGDELEEAA